MERHRDQKDELDRINKEIKQQLKVDDNGDSDIMRDLQARWVQYVALLTHALT